MTAKLISKTQTTIFAIEYYEKNLTKQKFK